MTFKEAISLQLTTTKVLPHLPLPPIQSLAPLLHFNSYTLRYPPSKLSFSVCYCILCISVPVRVPVSLLHRDKVRKDDNIINFTETAGTSTSVDASDIT